MSTIKNHINTYANTTAYDNDLNKDFPNISYIQATDEVKWNKYDPDHIVCKYNVTSTESATKLLNSSSGITYQTIDGVKQQYIQRTYTFNTLGEHIVKYKLSGTSIQNIFYQCSNLTSITIPNGVTSIAGSIFFECRDLGKVILPNTLTLIINNAFRKCSNLTNIVIPKSVTSIGDSCFDGSGLTSITVLPSVPPTLGNLVFYGLSLTIYVAAESVETYKSASGWSDYASRIQAIPTT